VQYSYEYSIESSKSGFSSEQLQEKARIKWKPPPAIVNDLMSGCFLFSSNLGRSLVYIFKENWEGDEEGNTD